MFRPVLDVALLVSVPMLLIGGIAAYPDVPTWMLVACIGMAALLFAPVGAGRTAAPAGVK